MSAVTIRAVPHSISGGCRRMSLLRKSVLALVVPAAGTLLVTGAASAHAAGDLYGAIVRVDTLDHGKWRYGFTEAIDYPSQDAADQAALAACGGDKYGCTVVARIHNECGAVAERDMHGGGTTSPNYYAGTGPSRGAAENKALINAGPDPRNPSPVEMALGSTTTYDPVMIVDTICTSNAG